MHITLRGLRFLDVGILIYPILGKVLFQISFTNQENILAHNTALVTSGNSGLPRLNSSRKSSDIPLLTQSPIWVNPMGPITLSFGKKRYSVTTPGDNLQISSTKRAFIECVFLPRRLRSLHQGYFPDLIDQHDQHSVSTGIHVNETRSQQSAGRSARAACNAVVSMTLCGAHAGWHVNKPDNKSRTTPAWQLDHVNPAYSLKRHTMIMIIKIMITIII